MLPGVYSIPYLHCTQETMRLHESLFSFLTGHAYISLADYGASDLVIVYPCTANTIGKMANGIDDTSVTSILSVAVGANIPVIICPAMHESMFQNKLILANILKLKQIGINFLEPNLIEGKAKVADLESVVSFVIKKLERISRNSWLIAKKSL